MKYKKIIIFLLTFSLIFNVKADMCKYKIDDAYYKLQYDVVPYKNDWRDSYDFYGKDTMNLYSDSGAGQGGDTYSVVLPKKTNIFSKFAYMGNGSGIENVCPVLVSIGGNSFTVMPYYAYVLFFSPNNTVDCEECNEDSIKGVSVENTSVPFSRIYKLDDVCGYLEGSKIGVYIFNKERVTASRGCISDFCYTEFLEDVPLLGYVYYNRDYSSLVKMCNNYSKKGFPSGVTLKDYFKEYNDGFIIGEVVSNESSDTCPIYNKREANESEIIKCLNEKGDELDSSMSEFQNACTENEMRAIQSYASGSVVKFYDKKSVSGYLNNEIKMLFSSFSDGCGSAADKLYSNINNMGTVLYSYSSQDRLVNSLSYLYVQSKYLSGYSLLTSINPNVKVEEDTCILISKDLKDLIIEILDALKIGSAVIVIFLSIVDVYKVIVASDDGAKKKLPSLVSKRVIALCIILLLPTIVMIVLDFLNKYIPVDSSKCVISDLE